MIRASMFRDILLSFNFFALSIAQSRPFCLEGAFPAPQKETVLQHESPVYSAAWSPDGRQLVSAGKFTHSAHSPYSLNVWSGSGWKALQRQKSSTTLYSVAWSPDGSQLASASKDKSVKVWNTSTSTWKYFRTLSGHTHKVYSVAWHPDGTQLASASKDHTVKIWDVRTGKLLVTFKEHKGRVTSVAWHPNGKWLASASKDNSVKIWRSDLSVKRLRTLDHKYHVWSVAWSPDGRHLASTSEDGSVKIWDSSTWKLLVTLLNHAQAVIAVAWSPDGRRLASASKDHSVMVWDTITNKLLRILSNHTGTIWCVAWSPDGRRLASASEDLSVVVWDVNVHVRLTSREDPGIVRDHAALVLSAWIYNASIATNSFRCPPNFVLPTGKKLNSTLIKVTADDPQNRLNSFFAYVMLTSIPFHKRFGRSLYVVFKGTEGIADVLCDIGIQDNHVAYQDHRVGIQSQFHQEIANRAHWLLNETIALLERIARQDEEDGLETEIILTGHSMGGAHAAALYALLQFSDTSKYESSIGKMLKRVRLVSFGAPMIFAKFTHMQPSEEFLRVMSSATNYVNRNDPIPRAFSEVRVGKLLQAMWDERSWRERAYLSAIKDKLEKLLVNIPDYDKSAKMYRHFLNLRLLDHTGDNWYDYKLSAESFDDHFMASYDDAFRNSEHRLVKSSDVASSHDAFRRNEL